MFIWNWVAVPHLGPKIPQQLKRGIKKALQLAVLMTSGYRQQ